VGRRSVSMGKVQFGTFMSKPLPWLVWSYGARQLRLFHHERPFFATRLPLLTVKRAKVELKDALSVLPPNGARAKLHPDSQALRRLLADQCRDQGAALQRRRNLA
jgi:hypothetical protein